MASLGQINTEVDKLSRDLNQLSDQVGSLDASIVTQEQLNDISARLGDAALAARYLVNDAPTAEELEVQVGASDNSPEESTDNEVAPDADEPTGGEA